SVSHKKGGKQGLPLAALSTVRANLGVKDERSVRLDQPRVTTGGGALPFPIGPLPTHPLTPMARTIEQTAIRNFFIALPMLPSILYCQQIPLWLHFGNTLTASTGLSTW